MELTQRHASVISATIMLAELPRPKWISASALCEALNVRQPYFVALLRRLYVADVVEVNRLQQYRYRLKRPAERITLLQILEAIDGEVGQSMPVEFTGLPQSTTDAIVAGMALANRAFRKRLASITLADLRAAKAA